jgi:hypothetical protein
MNLYDQLPAPTRDDILCEVIAVGSKDQHGVKNRDIVRHSPYKNHKYYKNSMNNSDKQKQTITQVASKRVLEQNTAAFKIYDSYKKTADIIERAEFASGKRVSFRSDGGSTLDFQISLHDTYSTTAQTL